MPLSPLSQFSQTTRPFFSTSAPQCPSCQKSVYAAEQVLGPVGTPYHKLCLKCTSCAKILDAFSIREHGHEPYCKLCHSKAFGIKGVGYGNAVVGEYVTKPNSHSTSPISPLTKPPPSASPAEITRPAHLPSRIQNPITPPPESPSPAVLIRKVGLRGDPRLDGDDFDPPSISPRPYSFYPRSTSVHVSHPVAYSREILDDQPHGFPPSTQRVTPADANPMDDQDFEPPSLPTFDIIVKARPKPSDNAYHADQSDHLTAAPTADSPVSPFQESGPEPAPTRVVSREPALSRASSTKDQAAPFSHKPPIAPPPKPSLASLARHQSIQTQQTPPAFIPRQPSAPLSHLGADGPRMCPRCSQTVYHAEQVLAIGKKWHKRCLRCQNCSKALDANMNERDGKPYCVRCYDQAFGVASQGFVLRAGFGTK